MRTIYQLGIALLLTIVFRGNMYSEDRQWSFDEYGYEYDMAVCATVTLDGAVVTNLSDYEIAAFCGKNCRGIGTLLTAEKDGQSSTYFYLRIRSNTLQGETISFRIYQKSTRREMLIQQTLNFENNSLIGTPSEPMLLAWKGKLIGDVTDDGYLTDDDVTALVNYILGRSTLVNEAAAYVNGDDKIDIADVVALIALIK